MLLISLFISWRKTKAIPFHIKLSKKQKFNTGVYILIILVFGFLNVSALTGYSTNQQPIELAFPLKNGTYYVGHGGSHTQLNYHHAYESQQYALDIVKLNKFGVRTNGLKPKELEKYAIYEDILYSPCDGEVLEVRNHLPDVEPGEKVSKDPEGNYIAIACDNTDAILYIAHMKQNSVKVEKGDTIKQLEPIGLVGNSGNTDEPHLHIHAEKDGVGVPIVFDGEFLIRNDLVK